LIVCPSNRTHPPGRKAPLELTSYREINISYHTDPGSAPVIALMIERSLAMYVIIQVKYTNPVRFARTDSRTRTIVRLFNQTSSYFEPGEGAGKRILLISVYSACRMRAGYGRTKGTISLKKSDFFWIKSSAKRAFGECLGSKRR